MMLQVWTLYKSRLNTREAAIFSLIFVGIECLPMMLRAIGAKLDIALEILRCTSALGSQSAAMHVPKWTSSETTVTTLSGCPGTANLEPFCANKSL